MKKLIIPLLLILGTLFIVFNEFKEVGNHSISFEKRENIHDKDINFSKFWSTNLDTNLNFNQLWDVSTKEKIKKIIKSDIDEVQISTKNKMICIDKSCYTLLAIAQSGFETKALLFNAKLKPKIQGFPVNSILEEQLKIINIDDYSVVFEELNRSHTWKLKIFDVNITKYKPKEIE